MSPHAQGFQAGVEAMRAQVLAYLADPNMRESFMLMGPRVLATVAHALLGTADDIECRATMRPEMRSEAMNLKVALAAALDREAQLRERLAWTIGRLDEIGQSMTFTLGMCRSLDDCRRALTTPGASDV